MYILGVSTGFGLPMCSKALSLSVSLSLPSVLWLLNDYINCFLPLAGETPRRARSLTSKEYYNRSRLLCLNAQPTPDLHHTPQHSSLHAGQRFYTRIIRHSLNHEVFRVSTDGFFLLWRRIPGIERFRRRYRSNRGSQHARDDDFIPLLRAGSRRRRSLDSRWCFWCRTFHLWIHFDHSCDIHGRRTCQRGIDVAAIRYEPSIVAIPMQ